MERLTKKQKEVLDFILANYNFIKSNDGSISCHLPYLLSKNGHWEKAFSALYAKGYLVKNSDSNYIFA